jgi:hypothetical protein
VAAGTGASGGRSAGRPRIASGLAGLRTVLAVIWQRPVRALAVAWPTMAITRREKTMTNAIEASGLVKRFGKTTALAGVDLVARPGTVLGVLGPKAPAITDKRSVARFEPRSKLP